jgi:hypothetical protein
MRRLLRPSILPLLLATAACAGGATGTGTGTAPDTAGTTETASGDALRIENRTNSDMDIYIRPQAPSG